MLATRLGQRCEARITWYRPKSFVNRYRQRCSPLHRAPAVLAAGQSRRQPQLDDPSRPDAVAALLAATEKLCFVTAIGCQAIAVQQERQRELATSVLPAPSGKAARGQQQPVVVATAPSPPLQALYRGIPALQGWAIIGALLCGWLLRRRTLHSALPANLRSSTGAAARLLRLEAAFQAQADAASSLARQVNKLQSRVRLVARDFRMPVKQLQQSRLESAEVLTSLTTKAEQLDVALRDTQALLAQLQGVSARQLQVTADAIRQDRAARGALEERLTKLQAALQAVQEGAAAVEGATAARSVQQGAVPMPHGAAAATRRAGATRGTGAVRDGGPSTSSPGGSATGGASSEDSRASGKRVPPQASGGNPAGHVAAGASRRTSQSATTSNAHRSGGSQRNTVPEARDASGTHRGGGSQDTAAPASGRPAAPPAAGSASDAAARNAREDYWRRPLPGSVAAVAQQWEAAAGPTRGAAVPPPAAADSSGVQRRGDASAPPSASPSEAHSSAGCSPGTAHGAAEVRPAAAAAAVSNAAAAGSAGLGGNPERAVADASAGAGVEADSPNASAGLGEARSPQYGQFNGAAAVMEDNGTITFRF